MRSKQLTRRICDEGGPMQPSKKNQPQKAQKAQTIQGKNFALFVPFVATFSSLNLALDDLHV
jgi:hypothetical protein